MAKKTKPVSNKETQDALEGIDRVFHEKARLGIMTTIIGFPDGMNFNELKELCNLTDGNFCLLYTSPSPRDQRGSRMPSSA